MKIENEEQSFFDYLMSLRHQSKREAEAWDYEVKERQTAKMEELSELGTYVLSNITEFDAWVSNGRLCAGRTPIRRIA